MKNLLLILLFLSSLSLVAQDNKPEKKPEYTTSVKLTVQDVNTFIEALNKWRDIAAYDPKASDAEKVRTIKNIDLYLPDLMRRIKIDSVLVDSVKVKPSKKK